jgi:phage shock protein PspC (stress-responsive transcriptional regulator)
MDERPEATSTAPPPQAPGYRRLYRRTDRAILGGVAAGLGDYFSIDPLVFRVGFVIAGLIGGAGIFAYLLLWWLVPPAGLGRGPAADRVMSWLRGLPTWLGVALLIVGAAAVAKGFGLWHPAVFWGVTLIALGMLLFFEGRDPSLLRRQPWRAPAGEDQPPQLLPPADSPDAVMRPQPTLPQPGPLPPPGYAATDRSAERPRRDRSALGWLTLGVTLLGVGLAAILDSAGVVAMTLDRYLALSLAIIGLGLLVGARWGRARWLAVPGLLLVPLVFAASLIDVPIQGGTGQRVYRPPAVDEVLPVYHLGAGDLVLDLRDVVFGPGTTSVTATVAAGQIEVFVPPDVVVNVHAGVGAGEIDLLGTRYDGLRVEVDRTFDPAGSREAVGHLDLDLRTGLGRVVVSRLQEGALG